MRERTEKERERERRSRRRRRRITRRNVCASVVACARSTEYMGKRVVHVCERGGSERVCESSTSVASVSLATAAPVKLNDSLSSGVVS
jgi:hypothetical protein